MAPGFSTFIFLLFSVFLIQCNLQITDGHRKFFNGHDHVMHEDNRLRLTVGNDGISGENSRSDRQLEPELNVFFRHNHLKPGKKMPIYFPKKDPSTSPHLLSKQESDSIPFSSSHFSEILSLFSFPEDSTQAKAIKSTIHHCEFPPIKGETKFCASSLESMLDSVTGVFGLGSKIKLLSTDYLTEPITPLQNYTIAEAPVEISAPKMMACHRMPYPYAVFYCHGQASDNVLYKVVLEGEDGGRVEAAGICHMDTSQWNPDHVAFRVMKTLPGASPVCHFFPADNLIWIPAS